MNQSPEFLEKMQQFAIAQLEKGITQRQVRETLIAKRVEPKIARQMVGDTAKYDPAIKPPLFRSEAIIGGCMLVFGIGITVWSYQATNGTGAVVATGAIVGGLIMLFRGFFYEE